MNALTSPAAAGEITPSEVDYILIDGSSSMKTKWWEFMAAVDTFVGAVKANNINSRVICSVFTTVNACETQRDTPAADWQPLDKEPLTSHWTMTNLYDGINGMARHMRDLDPSKGSILIVTDGEENASEYTDATQARAILDWLKAKGFQVTFVGCDFNNSEQARLLGMDPESAVGVATARLTDAASALAAKRNMYSKYGYDMHFSDEEKQTFGGYLGAPKKD